MAFFEFANIEVAGISAAVPKDIVSIEDFKDSFGEKRVNRTIKSIGVKEYRKTREHQTASDLGFCAAENLIEKLHINPDEIGALVFVAHSTDYRRPATACVLHKRLQLNKNCVAFDINLGCSAFVYGINVVAALMQNSDISKAMVIIGETVSKLTNPEDAATAMIFGDGGSAVLLQKKPDSPMKGLLRSDGTGYKAIITPAGGFRNLSPTDEPMEWEEGNVRTLYNTNMDGVAVFNFSIEEVPKAIEDFLEKFSMDKDDFDVFALHQANRFMHKQIAKRLKISMDKVPSCMEKYGNASAAAIPLLLCDQYGDSHDETINILSCGFGVGLSWGVLTFKVSVDNIFPVIESDEIFEEGIINGPEDMQFTPKCIMEKDIFVTQPSLPQFEDFIEEIRTLWDSKWITNMGIKHRRLQEELEAYLNVDHVELFVNGHMALEMTLQAFELEGEVITTPFTFISTTHAIVRNGLKPVFCDIREEDFTIDADKIEPLINENTSAIVPVHVYGNICDVEKIEKIADKYKLKVIYDAAHAFGETYKGRSVGCFGDASCFSFHATKVFNSIEGGATCYKDEQLGEKLYGLKNFGIRGEELIDAVGANAKMNEFCAAMGICNLRYIDEEIEKRSRVFGRYVERLNNIEGLKLFKSKANTKANYSYFPVIIDEKTFGCNRDELVERLKRKSIFSRKYFYPTTNNADCYKNTFNNHNTPIADVISNNVITLPLYAGMTMETVDYVCDAISNSR